MYHVYVYSRQRKDFRRPWTVKTEDEANALIRRMLRLLYGDSWKHDGQYVFNDGRPGGPVAAYYADIEAEEREEKEHAQWLAELPEYGIYGKAGMERIKSDAEILAGSVTSTAELEEDARELWDRFVEAGGDDSHSGGSWYGVKCEAYAIVKAREEATPA